MRRRDLLAVPFALFVGALAAAQSGPCHEVVRKMLVAFNAHDAGAMVTLVTDDVEWLSVDGATISVETRGKQALRESMEAYFHAIPSARSEIEDLLVSGKYVVVRERAHWKKDGAELSQSALAVYECRGDRIARVWYYPAEE